MKPLAVARAVSGGDLQKPEPPAFAQTESTSGPQLDLADAVKATADTAGRRVPRSRKCLIHKPF